MSFQYGDARATERACDDRLDAEFELARDRSTN